MSAVPNSLVTEIATGAPAGLDLTDDQQLEKVEQDADKILQSSSEPDVLSALEYQLIDHDVAYPLLVHLAVKLARSRVAILSFAEPTHLSVVFAMYKEHRRIRPRTPDNPVGEDFLRRKIRQLDWLVQGNPRVSWQLFAVDDGCPEGSGRIASEIVDEMDERDRVRVLFLEQAVRRDDPVIRPLTDTSESQKGGSVLLGMRESARQTRANHVILYTDADLSTHLAQCALLMEPILRGGSAAAIGSRRETTSVVVKKGRRNTRGKLFIYLWKQLLPVLDDVVDTQCGFKAFRADMVEHLVTGNLEKRFAFDIELLLKTRIGRFGSITKVPIAWIDSEAASTTTDLEPYLSMLETVVALYRHYLPSQPRAEEIARLVETLDGNRWSRLIECMPASIADADPRQFGDGHEVSAAELRRLALE